MLQNREYVTITKDFALRAAEAFATLGTEQEPFNFVYVSGHGTTVTPGRTTSYFGRIKGETEVLLAEMMKTHKTLYPTSIRPCFIDYASHKAIHPYIPKQEAYKAFLTPLLGPPIRYVAKSYWSPTEPLGKFLTEMAMGKWNNNFDGSGIIKLGDFRILENAGFRRLAELD